MGLRSELEQLVKNAKDDIARGDSGYYDRDEILRLLSVILKTNSTVVHIVRSGFNNEVVGVFNREENAENAMVLHDKEVGAKEYYIESMEVDDG